MNKTTKELMEECGMDTTNLHLYESQQGKLVPLQYDGTLEDFKKEYNAISWEDFKKMMIKKMQRKNK